MLKERELGTQGDKRLHKCENKDHNQFLGILCINFNTDSINPCKIPSVAVINKQTTTTTNYFVDQKQPGEENGFLWGGGGWEMLPGYSISFRDRAGGTMEELYSC